MVNKVVLITGCSSGFGYYTAKLLAELGYKVYAGIRKREDLDVFTELPVKAAPKIILLDVTWPQEKINDTIKKIIGKEKRVDVLVNNAGFAFLGAVETFTEAEVKEQFETNLLGLFKVTKSVLPHMRAEKTGLVINISSISGLFTTAYYGVYSASKYAVEALTQALRTEEYLYGINVVSVNPGGFETKLWDNKRFPKETKTPFAKFNEKVETFISQRKSRRGDPMVVAKKIKEIIETQSPRKNYLVGWDALSIYYASRLLPQFAIDWLTKKVIKKLA